jgi:hypothetical protein
MKNNEEFIKEINQHIKDSLNEWSDILVDADYNGWGVDLEFDEEDLLNILQMFNSIWANSAIKRGVFTEDNVVRKMAVFQKTIDDVFGVNTVKLTDSVLGNNISELN